ncbi:hypothetical protein C7377_0166 [Balneicella halophila]|uniref:WW domain-containing protein n=1 Tax=Balneicella halophila TaxID=1537566 RepID=A0A7L4UQ16_BALHA|nr:hypothetical protein [Balneicella halophila]PVX51875.1 hypothetical protein C7377_0166 [Balneicella halophila]
MKTLLKKTNDAVVLFAFFLLGTVGISAQTYQDDVYYSPSKDTSKKVEKPKIVKKKEVKRTYRANDKAEDFSVAQEKYAQMLREKQEDSNYAQNTYEEEVTWVEDTQGLTPKHEIQKEVSLYNTGDVNADNPQADAYYEDSYVLWQPTTVTRVYAQPRFYSNFYFGFNFGWGGAYYSPVYRPYYTHYYDPFYWDYYYSPYWGNPFYYGYSPFYSSWYYPYAGWRHRYYTPYYRYDSYYYTKYYRDHYTYSQRPREYSNRSKNSRRQSLISDRRTNNSSAKAQRVRAENMNRRYSALADNRKNTDNSSFRRSSKTHDSRLSTNKNDIRRRNPNIQDNKTNSAVKRRVSRNTVHQGKAPYVRRIEKSSTSYRRSTATPKQSVNKPNTNSRVYRRSTPQEYRRMNSNKNIRRSTPTIYRKTTSPARKSNRSSVSTKAPKRTSTYRTTTPRSKVNRSPSPSRNTSVRSTSTRSTKTSTPSRSTRTRNRR